MPVVGWKATLYHFAIVYEARMPKGVGDLPYAFGDRATCGVSFVGGFSHRQETPSWTFAIHSSSYAASRSLSRPVRPSPAAGPRSPPGQPAEGLDVPRGNPGRCCRVARHPGDALLPEQVEHRAASTATRSSCSLTAPPDHGAVRTTRHRSASAVDFADPRSYAEGESRLIVASARTMYDPRTCRNRFGSIASRLFPH